MPKKIKIKAPKRGPASDGNVITYDKKTKSWTKPRPPRPDEAEYLRRLGQDPLGKFAMRASTLKDIEREGGFYIDPTETIPESVLRAIEKEFSAKRRGLTDPRSFGEESIYKDLDRRARIKQRVMQKTGRRY